MDDLTKRIGFLKILDEAKSVLRQTPLADSSRMENDAEHMWHLAVTAIVLEKYCILDIDLDHVIRLALFHDVIEIYSGDTYAYDEKAKLDQHKREMEAAEKLFSVLPEEQGSELKSLFIEFEAMETNDSLYANACDRFQPFMLNLASGGSSWVSHGVYADQIRKRMAPIKQVMPEVYRYVEENIESSKEKGLLK